MRRGAWIVPVLSVAVVGLLATTWAGAQPGDAGRTMAWQLEQASIEPGTVSTMPEGVLVQDIVVRTRATSIGDAQAPEGACRMVISLFRPSEDRPGQQAHRWYARGTWRIGEAAEVEAEERHGTDVVSGTLAFDSDEDPFADPVDIQALVRLSTRRTDPRGIRSEGSFTGNSRFEGILTVSAHQSPGR